MNERYIFRERLRRNSKFRSARQEFMRQFPDYPHGVWTEELVRALDTFITTWGMAPIDPDSKEFETDPLYYYQQVGKDGAFLIRVYPWTSEGEVLQEYRRIREHFPSDQEAETDSETVIKIADLVNRGEDFHDIGRQVFKDSLTEQGQQELKIDIRFEQLMKIFQKEDLSPDEAREKSLAKLEREAIFNKLNCGYQPGTRTRSLEKKARKLYELLKPALE